MFSLLRLLFFLHVEELVILVVEFVLKESQFLRRNDFDSESILELPLQAKGNETLVDECGNIRIDIQRELLDANLVDQLVDFSFQLIGKQNARLHLASTETGRAGFLYIHIHGRSYTLSCNLHQSELAQRQNVVLGTILLHVLAHTLVEHLSVFCQIHVDEIDNNDASHVSQPQLSCQFVGSTQVYIKGVSLLTFFSGAVAAVDIHYMQRLGVLDNKISSVLIVDHTSEARLNLLCNVEVVEDRYLSCIELHDVCLVWCNE